ncbi:MULTISPECIES: hypothetical protein [Nocardiopsis]|jgi:hypothetical protein|uniref:Uncharacterized protein n=2 Tax=Nocardiopsis alba TaxID=53437 RepID=A0A7K2IPL1_9ACTN|nr:MULTISPECIES: hypothetical protein [Nocardiopsis]AFR05902.1 hypothetical protein B005_0739 [Nocardiopsis alba ATCC BAA-2165]MEC3895891.1 hypothetical protein [Nocardiopsis sp. LDBS1602]MYR31816.1 hypothetical protein [Nocardiopsis alba]
MSPFTRPAGRRGRLSEHARLLECVQGILERSDRAVPWEPDTVGLPDARSDSALARINDVAFYANARDEVAALAGVCVDLLRLHGPAENDEDRCRNCHLDWPCPTFGEISRLLR